MWVELFLSYWKFYKVKKFLGNFQFEKFITKKRFLRIFCSLDLCFWEFYLRSSGEAMAEMYFQFSTAASSQLLIRLFQGFLSEIYLENCFTNFILLIIFVQPCSDSRKSRYSTLIDVTIAYRWLSCEFSPSHIHLTEKFFPIIGSPFLSKNFSSSIFIVKPATNGLF